MAIPRLAKNAAKIALRLPSVTRASVGRTSGRSWTWPVAVGDLACRGDSLFPMSPLEAMAAETGGPSASEPIITVTPEAHDELRRAARRRGRRRQARSAARDRVGARRGVPLRPVVRVVPHGGVHRRGAHPRRHEGDHPRQGRRAAQRRDARLHADPGPGDPQPEPAGGSLDRGARSATTNCRPRSRRSSPPRSTRRSPRTAGSSPTSATTARAPPTSRWAAAATAAR